MSLISFTKNTTFKCVSFYCFTLFSSMLLSAFFNFSYNKICGIQIDNLNMFIYSILISNSTTCKTIHKASYFFNNSVDNLLLQIF